MGCTQSSSIRQQEQEQHKQHEESILAHKKGIPPPTATATSASSTATSSDQQQESPIIEVALKKHRPGCTGMFWRSDPTGSKQLMSNDNWPRDGAKLRGYVVVVQNEKWLLAKEVLQAGSDKWDPAPIGSAMPFEYNNHYYLEQI